MITGPTSIKPEIGHIVETNTLLIKAEETMIEILDQAIGVHLEIAIGRKDTDRMIGMTIKGKIMVETVMGIIIGKIMVEVTIGNKGLEVQVGTVIAITIETIQERDMTEVEIQIRIGTEKGSQDQDLGWNQKVVGMLTDQEQN